MVVAVNQPNPKANSTKSARVSGLTRYILAPENTNANEKCVHFGTRNFLSNDIDSVILEMSALAEECVKSKDPIRHDVISFREGEILTKKQVEEAVDLYLKTMGLEGHQCVYGMHMDTDNVHIHIEVNRVNPETGKITKINKGFDKEALQMVCARLEHAQGWQPEKGSRYVVNEHGKVVERDREPSPPEPSKGAKDFEVRTGLKSAERIVIEDATPILKTAKSWKEVHERLAKIGVQYERSGSGAVMHVGDVTVKASTVDDRSLRFGALQKKLGAFEPANQEKPNVYFEHKPDHELTKSRSPEAKIQDSRDAEYLAQNSMRRLSKCSLARSDREAGARVLSIDARTCRRPTDDLRRSDTALKDRSKEPLNQQQERPKSRWREYANERSEHYKNRRLETDAQRKRHELERKELQSKLRKERLDAIPKLRKGESRHGLTNVIKQLLAYEQAKAKLDIKDRHTAERKALKEKYPRFPASYEDWLKDKGMDSEAQRYRYQNNPDNEPCSITGHGRSKPLAVDLRHYSPKVNGFCVDYYSRDNKLDFTDRGQKILITGWKDERATLAALQLSAEKWGEFSVTGCDEYKAMCVKLAAKHNLRIINPELQDAITKERKSIEQERERELNERAREYARMMKEYEAKQPKPEPVKQQQVVQPDQQKPTAPEILEQLKQDIQNTPKPYRTYGPSRSHGHDRGGGGRGG
jgi:hypothetical protein